MKVIIIIILTVEIIFNLNFILINPELCLTCNEYVMNYKIEYQKYIYIYIYIYIYNTQYST